jgi:hypothetical protein
MLEIPGFDHAIPFTVKRGGETMLNIQFILDARLTELLQGVPQRLHAEARAA